MIGKRSSFFKLASYVLLICLIVQDAAYAAPGFKPSEIKLFEKPAARISFPESVATVEDTWIADGGLRIAERNNIRHPKSAIRDPLVYLIQDAHTNPSGQINLSKSLNHIFDQEKDLKYVFIEAGVGNNSLSGLRKLAPLAKRKQVAEEFLRKGLLHGEEYLDLTNNRPFTIWGVEEASLYTKSLEVYRKSEKRSPCRRKNKS